jgi:hypothetical protein
MANTVSPTPTRTSSSNALGAMAAPRGNRLLHPALWELGQLLQARTAHQRDRRGDAGAGLLESPDWKVIIGQTRAVLVPLLIIEFPRDGGAKNPRCVIPSVQRLTTHRKPIWVAEVSGDCGDRAAGRYRKQYSGAHKCDPPFNALRIVESAAGAATGEGPQHRDVTTCLA